MSRRAVWGLMALVLAIALAVGSRGQSGPPTLAQRELRITSDIRCPTCQGLSAAVSEAPAAVAIREEVRRRLAEGQTEAQIEDYLADRYGPGIRLRPEARGMGVLVWALPVAGAAFAVVGLALAFRRWRRDGVATASETDRNLVAKALSEPTGGP
ncbi:MAG: cytochrome c-type biogenesis protein [Acidimicrobiales bacterium]